MKRFPMMSVAKDADEFEVVACNENFHIMEANFLKWHFRTHPPLD